MSISAQLEALNATLVSLESSLSELDQSATNVELGENTMWLLVCAVFGFFIQTGFAMIETGSVRSIPLEKIFFKNLVVTSITAVGFWFLGYGFAFGNTRGGFIGISRFGLSGKDFDIGDGYLQLNYQTFIFQWVFATVAVSIVSGSVAGRCKLEVYLLYAAFISSWIYPIIVHWCWGDGWLSPFAYRVQDYLFYSHKSNNFIDFAGSGVVHTVGGVCGLVGAIALGPRKVVNNVKN